MIAFLKRLGRATIVMGLFLIGIAAIAYWYVNSGPVPLDAFTPRLQASIARAVPGLQIEFGHLTATRDALRRAVLIKATEVTLRHPLLARSATVAEMSLLVPQGALVGGDPIPRQVTLAGVRTAIRWTPEQVRSWLAGDGSSLPPRLHWLRGLDEVRIEDVSVDLIAGKSGQTRAATPSDSEGDVLLVTSFTAERGLLLNSKQIQLQVLGQLKAVRGPARLDVEARGKAIPSGQWEAKITTKITAPQKYIRAFAPTLDVPQRLPSLTVITDLTATDIVRGETILRVAPGALQWAGKYSRPLAVQKGKISLVWNDASPEILLKKADVTAEGVELASSGVVRMNELEKSTLTAGFKTLSIPQLNKLWPAGAAEGGHAWIADNITAGIIRDGKLSLSPSPTGPVITLDFWMDNLTAQYRRPMAPLVNAYGTGRLTNAGLTLEVEKGFINGVTVPKARVLIGPFKEAVQYADVDLSLAGNLPNLLTILDTEPLGFISRYGLKPQDVTGAAAGNVKLKIPLLKSISLDDIAFSATADSKGARVPDVYAGKALERTDLAFVIKSDGLMAKGTGTLNGNPLNIVWTESFSGTSANPTRYEVSTRTSTSALANLGIDVTALALGDFPASLVLEGKGGMIASGMFAADIASTQLTVPPFGIVKPVGVAGQATGHFSQTGRTVIFDDIQVTSVPVSARLSAKIPIDAGRSDYAISSFVFGENRLHGNMSFAAGQPLLVTIAGGEVDLRPELAAWRRAQTAKEKPRPNYIMTASALSTPGSGDIKTHLVGKLERVRLLNAIDFQAVTLDAQLEGDLLATAQIAGRLDEKSTAQIAISRQGASRKLRLTSDNAGILAQALDLYANGKGGKLQVDADFTGRDKSLAIIGKATMTDFRLVNAPGLAKALTIASLTGLNDTLRGRGIEFRNVDAPFTLKRGIVDIRKASAVGPGLGVTMEGQVSRATGQTNMRGTIIPSYGLNAAVGKIPLVGKIIVGGKNQGLIGFNYRITGTMADPRVDVTKSSGLAPGFLRQLFKGRQAVIDPAYEEAAGMP